MQKFLLKMSKRETLFISSLIVSWYSSNIGVLLLNKFLLSNYGFRFPIFLTMCHMSACGILSYFSIVLMKIVPLQSINSRSQFFKIASLSVIFCGSVVGGNISLRYLPVSFNQAVGATTPFFTALFAYLMTFKTEAWATYIALIPVVAGVILASGGEPSFHLFGFIMCLGATAARACKTVLQGILLSSEGEKLNSMNLLLYMSPIAVAVLLPITLVMEPNVIDSTLSLGRNHKFMWLLLFLNSAMAYLANLFNFLVTKHTSPLTLQENEGTLSSNEMAGYPPPGAPWPTPRPSGYGYGYGGATSYGTHEGPYRTQEGPYRTQEGPYRTQEGQYGIPSAPPYGGPPPNSGRPPGSFGDLGNTPYQADYLSSTTPSGYPPSGYTRPGFTGYPVATQMWESGSPFGQLLPSAFAPGTDPIIIAYFEAADRDRSGFIDDKELQAALSHSNHNFSMRTVRLLMCHQNGRPTHKIGPKEFTSLYYNLQKWREIFEGCDRDRSGKLDVNELRDALSKIGCAVSPTMLSLLVSKYDHMGGINKAINYDNFIDCCLIVKGLTDKFKERDNLRDGNATFDYESFMMSVLPFLIA